MILPQNLHSRRAWLSRRPDFGGLGNESEMGQSWTIIHSPARTLMKLAPGSNESAAGKQRKAKAAFRETSHGERSKERNIFVTVLAKKAEMALRGANFLGIDNDWLHRPKSSRCALLVERSVYLPFPIPTRSPANSAMDGAVGSAGSGATGLRMVKSAWALGGSDSEPAGRTRPFSSSTSSVL